MNLMIFIIILFSHLMAARSFFSAMRQHKMPDTAHFAAISLILYYDIGLTIELLGFPTENKYFSAFFPAKENILLQAFMLLLIAPWLFQLGSQIIKKESKLTYQEDFAPLSKPRRKVFYLFTTVVSLVLAFSGSRQVVQADSIWAAREGIGAAMGPLIIILYFPLHFLAFYIRTSDAKTKKGLFFSLGLMFASIVATFAIGQRTNVLLPILIFVLFRAQLSLKKIVIFVSIAVIASAALLPIFKFQYSNTNSNVASLVAETVNGDLSRSGVLITALEMTEPVGTKTLPYPLAGYVYCLLYYVPRSIAPFKGWGTGQYFTADVVRTPVEDTSWGFGVGAIEEILLNVGFWWCFPVLLVYGMCMGFLDRLSSRMPSLVVPTRLAAIWLCGYDSGTLLLTFGTMAVIGLVFHYLFIQTPLSVYKVYGNSNVSVQKKLRSHTNKFL